MEYLTLYKYVILMFVALTASTIDTLAGGGGLITVPAILMSGMNPISALGTNKLQSAIGEFSAVLHFMRKKQVAYKVLLYALIYTAIGSILGTVVLQFTPTHELEKVIPFFLLAILVYYIFHLKRNNLFHNKVLIPDNKKFLLLGTLIGFYNGFFGPGTGSIWAVVLMKYFKLDMQKATMYAKPLNLMGNMTALSIFIVGGKIDFVVAILMGLGSFTGGKLGAHLVIYKDVKWLKISFLLIMSISTIATFIKYY